MIRYNAAEKVTVDTTQFSSTITIAAENHGFSTQNQLFIRQEVLFLFPGLTDGATYYAIRVDANSFKLAASSVNAGSGTALTITGGTGGSVR